MAAPLVAYGRGMKVATVCQQCLQESENPPLVAMETFQLLDFREDNLYRFTCPKGHEAAFVVQQRKFEILFNFGVEAYIDHYFRESVLSMYASLEDFMSYVVTVLLLDAGTGDAQVEECLKFVKFSERKLGAFSLATVLGEGELPSDFKAKHQRWVAERNKAAHEGKFFSADEVEAYGGEILAYMQTALARLVSQYPEAVERATLRHIRASHGKGRGGVPIGTMSIPTVVSVNHSGSGPTRFKRAVETVNQHRKTEVGVQQIAALAQDLRGDSVGEVE